MGGGKKWEGMSPPPVGHRILLGMGETEAVSQLVSHDVREVAPRRFGLLARPIRGVQRNVAFVDALPGPGEGGGGDGRPWKLSAKPISLMPGVLRFATSTSCRSSARKVEVDTRFQTANPSSMAERRKRSDQPRGRTSFSRSRNCTGRSLASHLAACAVVGTQYRRHRE